MRSITEVGSRHGRDRGEQGVRERDLYEKKLRAQRDEWKAELATMKAQAEGARADAQLTWKREVEELEPEIARGAP